MDTQKVTLDIKDVVFGEHLCSICKNKEQQFSQTVPFVIDGLTSNHKCVYVIHENSKEEVMLEFDNRGFQLKKYLDTKQLEILTVKETYLKEGYFEPDKLIDLISTIEVNALKEGYKGVRGIGEMSWVTGDMENHKKLIEYEVKLNDLTKNRNIILLCQYIEEKFSNEVLNNVIRAHKKIAIYGKLYANKYFYIDPLYFKEAKELPADSYSTIIDTIIEE